MGKEKKKSLGIKTTRYFTKTCTKCKVEYPNWFTNCPKCGAAWDSVEAEKITSIKEALKKTIKIVVKITEEDFNNALERVKLIFSADQGRSWYQMEMENQLDFFIAEITDVPVGSVIIYYIEVILIHGEQIIENNEGNYFHYKVGVPIEDLEKDQQISKGKIVNHAKKQLNKAVKHYKKYRIFYIFYFFLKSSCVTHSNVIFFKCAVHSYIFLRVICVTHNKDKE